MPRRVYLPIGYVYYLDDGTCYWMVDVNGVDQVAGRFVPGRPDVSTMLDPEGSGGVIWMRRQELGQQTGTSSQSGTSSGAPAPAAGTSSMPDPTDYNNQAAFGSALDAWLNWQVQNSMMSSEEARKAKKEADKQYAQQQSDAKASEKKYDDRYAEEQARSKRLEAEGKQRQQYYNVQESIQQGMQDAVAGLPLATPLTASNALTKWGRQLGTGFNANMPIKADPRAFIDYIVKQGFPSNVAPSTGPRLWGGG